MIDRLRRMIRAPDPSEEMISAYLNAPSDAELEGVEQRLRAAGVDVDELRTVRETSQLLRSLDTVEAPRSFALTPETLADQGYSDAEAEKILNPRARWSGLRLRNATVYVPLAIAGIAIIGAAMLIINDISDYAAERFDAVQESDSVIQTVVVEKVILVADTEERLSDPETLGEADVRAAPTAIAMPAQKSAPALPVVTAVPAASPPRIVTVVVEKEVVEIEVERETEILPTPEPAIAAQAEVAAITAEEREVVKEVEIGGDRVVEREVVVEVEKVVEVEMEAMKEVEILPTPFSAPAEMAAAPMTMEEDASEEKLSTPAPMPREIPCAIPPTATPTPTGSPSPSTTPEPTATMSPIPTCTPTPTPSPTPTGTPTSTP